MSWTRRRAWGVVACAGAAAVCAVLLAPAALSALGTGGAVATGTEAERARRHAEQAGVFSPDLLLALSPRSERSRRKAVEDGARRAVRALSRERDVRAVWSAESAGEPWLWSKDGRRALVAVRLAGTDRHRKEAVPRIVAAARSAATDVGVEPSGEIWANREIDRTIERDLRRAELLAAPALFAILVFAYGSVVSALLPGVVAALSVGCALPVLGLVARSVDVSRVAVSAALAVGIGLAVDYSLFLLARVREETSRGLPPQAALAVAWRSSGRSVVFSALAVTTCLAAVLLVPVPLLRGLSLAGMVVTLLSAVTALTVVPACLLLLGPLAQAWDPLRRWRRARTGDGSRFWRRVTLAVTARPFLSCGAVTVLLALMALPFTHVRLGVVDERTLPASAQAAAAAQRVRSAFTAPPDQLVTVVVSGPEAGGNLDGYRSQLASLASVTGVHQVTPPAAPGSQAAGRGPAVLLVAFSAGLGTREAEAVVEAVRATPAPGTIEVGGRAAEIVDSAAAVRAALPWTVAALAAGLLVLLTAFTRSVVAPLKALTVAVASLGAGLGALVVVFQDGRGKELLGGFTTVGTLDVSMLLFVLFITLALSVDYEVFLLGRIREEYARHGDNRRAIVDGIARTGRLLTCAALAVATCTAAMGLSGVALLKFVGIGVALGALVDAVLVRGVLVPAVMAALGPANWWAPAVRRPRARRKRIPGRSARHGRNGD
ncbi:MMPL family transporter [Streptomyces sp. CC224B]|uniref:MMPL family transporter n=1 Tax=Streptomyces sp. CC224B TaxID=3044571 RepID=UPI0024A9C396|nr:MMPL family transporter [Streptomyces sp. CC224B]